MSLYNVDPGIKKLQQELAEKRSRFNKLNDDTKFDSLFFMGENDFKSQTTSGPIWRDLHLKRAALIGIPYAA